MNIVLVNAPWASIDMPSLALGIIAESARTAQCRPAVETLYLNLDWAEWVYERTNGACTPADYSFFSHHSYFAGLGDWVFTSALYGSDSWRVDQFKKHAAKAGHDSQVAVLLHSLAQEFVSHCVDRILSLKPTIVGFTTTFQQNIASLALAQEIKTRASEVMTVFGGANCDGEQGAAIHRNYPYVDFVVRGEGEVVFPQLLDTIDNAGQYEMLPGLCWRVAGETRQNKMRATPLPPASIQRPNHDPYFAQYDGSPIAQWVSPKLVLESARGCWWGEKHHCTFCGLNGSSMQFRSKDAEKFMEEIETQVARHKVLTIYIVDNIMDMGYFDTLLKDLAQRNWDLHILYEVKANLTLAQVQGLAEAGVLHIQPGIESLNSNVLKLMDKGVTAAQNIRLLRDCESVGVTVSWNYLYGFPGETTQDYEGIIAQMPALHHLQPPGGTGRLAIERFSPYYDNPALGFGEKHASAVYRLLYDLPESELLDIAYVFDSPDMGIGGDCASRLNGATEEWLFAHPTSRLVYWDLGDSVIFANWRPGFTWTSCELTRPRDADLYRSLDKPRRLRALQRENSVADAHGGTDFVEERLAEWKELGLVFQEGQTFVAIATQANNVELVRLYGKGKGEETGDHDAVDDVA